MKAAQRLTHVSEYYFARKLAEIATLQKEGIHVLNLGIGNPDLPPPLSVVNMLQDTASFEHVHGYQSYRGIPELRKAMSHWYATHFDVKLNYETEVLPLIGSKEGVFHVSMAFLNPNDGVLVPNPGYPAYSVVTELCGGRTLYYDLIEKKNWQADLDQLSKLSLDDVKIMWVNYPNMPTGAKPDLQYFKDLIAFGNEYDILICHDNPYAFILNDNPMSLLKYDPDMSTSLELNSMSKCFNMAGWRVGMVAGHTDHIQSILQFKSNIDSGMFYPIQRAATEAFHLDKSWYDHLNSVYAERKEVAQRILDILGCSYTKDSSGLFVFGQIPQQYDSAYTLSDELLDNKAIFITPGGIFGSNANKSLRISLCSPRSVLLEALRRLQNPKKYHT